MQRKFRRLRPMPSGVVFMQWPGMDWEEMRRHLRLMKELGFTALKGYGLLEGFDDKKFCHMALDEGIIPWWYGEGGWEAVTDELLDRLGIPRGTPIEKLREDPVFLKHQEKVLRDRIDAMPAREQRRAAKAAGKQEAAWRYSTEAELLRAYPARLPTEAMPDYVEWLKARYGTLEELKIAWNVGHVGINGAEWTSWEQAAERALNNNKDHDYNRLKDVIRFKTHVYLRQLRRAMEAHREGDAHEPVRAGGEMSVFVNLTGRGVDMEGIGEVMADYGSLYPSTHMAWHFDKVDYELTRTVYMYSSIMADYFKGGWTATWESTGGPQQISGDKGWSDFARVHVPGYTIDAGVMTQLMLTYLGAGYRGFGFWCWSARTAGREGGEYSILDRNLQVGPRARRMGAISKAAAGLRDELWQARKEPVVGVLVDQENDIQWSVMTDYGREMTAEMPVRSRVGVSRALINANVPWEHVTAADLRAGLAARYKVIYLPGMLCLRNDLVDILAGYVRSGGRLVMDMPGRYFDEYSRITNTGPGSSFEALFGCTLNDYQYSSNVPRRLEGELLQGFVMDATATTAKVLMAYDNGLPAVLENAVGKGAAVLLGYEAAMACFKPGNDQAERRLVKCSLGGHESPLACSGAICYRLAAPAADHYFLINDGPTAAASLTTKQRYRRATDPVTGEELAIGKPIAVEAYSGRWVRMEK
jgi:beta-galactosidase